MTIKRLILILLTILVLAKVSLSLLGSVNQPQVQSRLELYQTDLILHASEFVSSDPEQTHELTTALLGNNPYKNAENQYEKFIDESEKNLAVIKAKIESTSALAAGDNRSQALAIANKTPDNSQQQLQQTYTQLQKSLLELKIKQGILQAQQGEINSAQKNWQNIANASQTAKVLQNLWGTPPQTSPSDQAILENNLDGWFRYRTLKEFYLLQENDDDLSSLEEKEQEIATQSAIKLIAIGSIPLLGGITGVALLLGLLVQLLFKKESSILATNHNLSWETPWDGEIIWQVLIVGFFCVGEIFLPLLFGALGFNPSGFSLRSKAIYVLISYLMMAGGGILILYLSIKSFIPLPKDWFRIKFFDKWFLWGIGGYLIALPLVVVVSLINQNLWKGQGGSNPLLSLALESQDWVVLAIFFITASIAAPVFEEFMFRGFLLSSLTRYLSVSGAIFVSSLIFAVAHLSVSEILPLTTLGMVLGFVYTRSRNLLAPMLVHCLWNSGTLISLFILGSGS